MKTLANPPQEYSQRHAIDVQSELSAADELNLKIGKDNFLSDGSICLKDTNGNFWKLSVSTSGTLSATAVTNVNQAPSQTSNPYYVAP
tara:strand:- start:524 stop:787 length:264 start_codon:yes stop_codon:yes gene_type:complete